MQLLIRLLITVLQGQIGAALVTFLRTTIQDLASTELSGAQKKAAVLEAAAQVAASGHLVNLAIELLVAQTKK